MARHTKRIPYVDLSAQWEIEKDELLPIIEKIMASGTYVNGENVKLIELKIADYCSVDHCVTLNSGTDALMLGMWALGIRPGDEVITPPNSFIASTAAIIHLGAKPIFVDVDPTQLIDINKIENLITKNTKAIMPVHLTGLMANMEKINILAEKYNLFVIEDAAQSIGSKLNGRLSGTFGDVGCFSTHPLKNLNCCGDGGFVITNNSLVANKIRQYRNHGFIKRNYSQKAENTSGASYSLREVTVNPNHVVCLREDDRMIQRLNEGRLPEDIDSRQRFTRVYLDRGHTGLDLTVVGSLEQTQKTLGVDSREVLRG